MDDAGVRTTVPHPFFSLVTCLELRYSAVSTTADFALAADGKHRHQVDD